MSAPRTAHSAAEMVAHRYFEIRERNNPGGLVFLAHLSGTTTWEQVPVSIQQRATAAFAELLGPDGCLDVRFPGADARPVDPDKPRRCPECGPICDHRIQVCECGPDCPLPPVQR